MLEKKLTPENMLANVEHSTHNALLALKQLESSLIKGRFKEGANSYEIMCKTLVGQKLWSANKNSHNIHKQFDEISRTAQNILKILTPYVSSLEKLTFSSQNDVSHEKIGTNLSVAPDPTPLNENSESILEILRTNKNKISYTRLRSLLGWDKKKLNLILSEMSINIPGFGVVVHNGRKFIQENIG